MPATPRPPQAPSDSEASTAVVVDRALSCRSVLWARGGSDGGPAAPLEELEVRRCPVGPVLAVDCPEWAGVRCRAYAPRGDAPPTVIAHDEAQAMLAGLAAEGTLTERYRRRLRPLTAEPTVEGIVEATVEVTGEVTGATRPAGHALHGRGTLPTGVTSRDVRAAERLPPPVAVPADRERRRVPTRTDVVEGDAP